MLVRYKYRNCLGKHGWYQCDCADFKKMWKNKKFHSDLYWCVVELPDKKYMVWSHACLKWYKSKWRDWFD